MLHIYCGDNSVESRNRYINDIGSFKDKGYEVESLVSTDLKSQIEQIAHKQGLFENKKVYVAENLLSKKQNRDIFLSIEANKEPQILVWEGTTDARTLKYAFKKATFYVSDLPTSIWKLLDGIRPGNKKNSIEMTTMLLSEAKQDPLLLLYMLQKRAKELILIKEGYTGSKKLADWQVSKLRSQATTWDDKRLTQFYEKLYEIERATKNSDSMYSTKQAIEILFSFYL